MIVIIGAGISGLTAARFLQEDFVLLEKENYIGGLATQYKAGDYWFDFAGHYFHFLHKQEIRHIVETICPFKKFNRKSITFAMERFVPFPLQYHLSYLPAAVRKQIVTEIQNQEFTSSDNLHDFLEINFGKTLFQLFFRPFLSKYYNIDLHRIISNMDKGSIPPPDIERVAAGASGKKFLNAGYNPRFFYPTTSLRDFIHHYAAPIPRDRIRLNETVTAVDTQKRVVKTDRGEYKYHKLITSMPLKNLMGMVHPSQTFPRPGEFHHISTQLVNVVLKRQRKRFHWVYIADEDIPFYRAGFYPLQPQVTCYLEKSVSVDTVIDREKTAHEIEYTLKRLKLIETPDEIQYFDTRLIPISYILFTTRWRELVPPLLAKLKESGIYSIGRFGSWNYTSMSDDIKGALDCLRDNRLL